MSKKNIKLSKEEWVNAWNNEDLSATELVEHMQKTINERFELTGNEQISKQFVKDTYASLGFVNWKSRTKSKKRDQVVVSWDEPVTVEEFGGANEQVVVLDGTVVEETENDTTEEPSFIDRVLMAQI